MRTWTMAVKAGVAIGLTLAGIIGFTIFPVDAVSQNEIEPEGVDLYPVSDYGWLTLYMHEVYELYTQSKKQFDKGEFELAEADLVVTELFLVESLKKLPDKLQDGKPFDKKGYAESVDKFKVFSASIRAGLKDKKWPAVPEGQTDPGLQICVGCHAAYNIPVDFHVDNKLKVMTQLMHQIYDVYRIAGPALQQKQWDQARYCFVALRPYIEQVPANIPETNQDGEKIDRQLFTQVYAELKKFNEDVIKKIEQKSFESGKPLPPPRLVMDNCKACHQKAKIQPPW